MSLPQSVRDDAAAVERYLGALFDDMNGPADRLAGSMRYATMNGGKRLRACLVLAAARLAAGGALPEGAMAVAASVECLHAIPLFMTIFRRWMIPTQGAASRPVISPLTRRRRSLPVTRADPGLRAAGRCENACDGNVRAVLVAALARAAGLDGMAGGQMLDLEAENRAMTLDEVRQMQAMKTGALIQYAAAAGGIHGGADAALQSALERYARDLGLAFQIADDLLDYDGDAELLGKPAGQDADRGRAASSCLWGWSLRAPPRPS